MLGGKRLTIKKAHTDCGLCVARSSTRNLSPPVLRASSKAGGVGTCVWTLQILCSRKRGFPKDRGFHQSQVKTAPLNLILCSAPSRAGWD